MEVCMGCPRSKCEFLETQILTTLVDRDNEKRAVGENWIIEDILRVIKNDALVRAHLVEVLVHDKQQSACEVIYD